MPLPRQQLAVLRKGAEAHQERIAELREGVLAIEEEIAVHEALFELAYNDQLMEAVGKVLDDPRLASSLDRWLPENVTLSSIDVEESVGRLTANLRVRSWNIEVVIDPESGFSTRPLSQGRLRQVNIVTT